MREDDFHRHEVVVHFIDEQIEKFRAFAALDVDFFARKILDHLVAAKHRQRILRGDGVKRLLHLRLRARRDLDIDPQAHAHAQHRQHQHRQRDPRDAHAVRPQRDEFVFRRHFAKDQQHRREKAPRDREGQRERQDVGEKGEDLLERRVVFHQQFEQLLEDIPEHQHDAQHRDRDGGCEQNLPANVAVDEFQKRAIFRGVPGDGKQFAARQMAAVTGDDGGSKAAAQRP